MIAFVLAQTKNEVVDRIKDRIDSNIYEATHSLKIDSKVNNNVGDNVFYKSEYLYDIHDLVAEAIEGVLL